MSVEDMNAGIRYSSSSELLRVWLDFPVSLSDVVTT